MRSHTLGRTVRLRLGGRRRSCDVRFRRALRGSERRVVRRDIGRDASSGRGGLDLTRMLFRGCRRRLGWGCGRGRGCPRRLWRRRRLGNGRRLLLHRRRSGRGRVRRMLASAVVPVGVIAGAQVVVVLSVALSPFVSRALRRLVSLMATPTAAVLPATVGLGAGDRTRVRRPRAIGRGAGRPERQHDQRQQKRAAGGGSEGSRRHWARDLRRVLCSVPPSRAYASCIGTQPTGIDASTSVPPPAGLSTPSCPPKTASRSASPTKPLPSRRAPPTPSS